MINTKNRNKTVFLGMSGGVDSSVSAIKLLQQGYQVVGVYIDMYTSINAEIDEKIFQEGKKKQSIVKSTCDLLKIDFLTWDFSIEFSSCVVQKFISSYKDGCTPNPCIYCNKFIKFGTFFEKAIEAGADFIATGHYAKINFNKINNLWELHRGIDANKDQSYFLYNLTQRILKQTIFPVGEMYKDDIKKIANEFNLKSKEEKESQDICFIKNSDANKFLTQNLNSSEGNIVDIDTQKVIGKHNGLLFYTIGQRKGIKIGADLPYYVISKDIDNNILYVGKGFKHNKLYKTKININNLNWISGGENKYPVNGKVQIRYQQKPVNALIINNNSIKLEEPMRAVSPGQSAVIYDEGNRTCLGGGIIV